MHTYKYTNIYLRETEKGRMRERETEKGRKGEREEVLREIEVFKVQEAAFVQEILQTCL